MSKQGSVSLKKEYFRDKMREWRTQNPLSQKKFVYCIEINDKKYIYAQKSDIIINRITVNDTTTNNDVIPMF
jgi:hypothetical protein